MAAKLFFRILQRMPYREKRVTETGKRRYQNFREYFLFNLYNDE